MNEITPKYEVLYSDLRNHFIGYYLASREFKLFMNSINHYDNWKAVYQSVKSNRGYISVGTDHEPGDMAETLAIYLNEIENQPQIEILVSEIIVNFIDFKKEKADFSDVIESAKSVGFSEESITKIEQAFDNHSKKTFPKKNNHEKTSAIELNMNNVFIVHGHNNEVKIDVARTLEKLGLNPIILHEQANSGKTIIEKFEGHSNVGFAIVLLTDDDFGKAKKDNNLNPRSRQNVILEMGYFIGKLGRNKVCPLYTKGVELPSDLYGLLYTEIDSSENWKIKIAKELKAAGYNIDINKII